VLHDFCYSRWPEQDAVERAVDQREQIVFVFDSFNFTFSFAAQAIVPWDKSCFYHVKLTGTVFNNN
jgi:hypothetical protein